MIRPTLTVLHGTVLAQVIGVLMLPVIGRIYSPDAFGDFQLFQSALSLGLPFAAFRLEYALLRVRRETSVRYVLALCIGINVVVALLVGAGLGVGARFLPAVHRDALWATWLFPVALLVAGILQTASYLPVRTKAYRLIAGSKMLQTGTFHAGAVTLGTVGGWATGAALVASDLVGRGASAALLLGRWIHAEPRVRWRRTRRHLAAILRRYRDDPRYAVPSSFVSALAAALPVFALTTLFSPAAAGQFGMAWRVGLMPIAMITFAVSQVVNSEVSEMRRRRAGGIWALVRRVFGVMALAAVVPIVVAAAFGDRIVPAVLGGQWGPAGRMIEVMTPFLFVSVVIGPVNTLLVVLGRQWVHLAWKAARAALLILVFWWARSADVTPVEAVLGYSGAMAAMGVVYLVLVRAVVKAVEPGTGPVLPGAE